VGHAADMAELRNARIDLVRKPLS